MKSVQVIIEPSKDGFGVMFKSEGLEHITSFGETMQEAKTNAHDAVKEYIAYCNETGRELPTILKGVDVEKMKFRYSYLLNYYFKIFPFLNISQFASEVNINSSLMRQYEKGIAMASEDKYLKVREGLHNIGRQLSSAL